MSRGTLKSSWTNSEPSLDFTSTEDSTVIDLWAKHRQKQNKGSTTDGKENTYNTGLDEYVFTASTAPVKIDLPIHVNQGEKVTIRIERDKVDALKHANEELNSPVQSVKSEVLQILELSQENKELKCAVEELQARINTLEEKKLNTYNINTTVDSSTFYVNEQTAVYEATTNVWDNFINNDKEERVNKEELGMYNELILKREKLENKGIWTGIILAIITSLIPLLTSIEWAAILPGITMFLSLTGFMLIRKKLRGNEDA